MRTFPGMGSTRNLRENLKVVIDSNYDIAVALITKRCAKPSMIQHVDINRLISLAPVYMENDVNRLRISDTKSRPTSADLKHMVLTSQITQRLWFLF